MFPRASRYYAIEIARFTTSEQREIVYVRRRFIPLVNDAAVAVEYKIEQGDRLDNVTAQQLGDPEQFWRLCDANEAMQPTELEEIGRWVKVPLPIGG